MNTVSGIYYYSIYVCVQTKISILLKESAINVVPWFDKKEKKKKNKNKEGEEQMTEASRLPLLLVG